MSEKEKKLEDILVITREDNQHGVTVYTGRITLQVDTAVNTNLANEAENIREIVAKQMQGVFNGMLAQWRMGEIDPAKVPDAPSGARAFPLQSVDVPLTTPGVIQMYKDNGIPCDQATVSCMARQGRLGAVKHLGVWYFDPRAVKADIHILKKIQQRTQEVQHANQQT